MASRASEIVRTKIADKLGLEPKEVEKTPATLEPIDDLSEVNALQTEEFTSVNDGLIEHLEEMIEKYKTKKQIAQAPISVANGDQSIIIDMYHALFLQSIQFNEQVTKWSNKRESYNLQRQKQLDRYVIDTFAEQFKKKDKLIDRMFRLVQYVIVIILAVLAPWAIQRGYIPFIEGVLP